MNLYSREIRRLDIKSFLNRCCLWRCCRCCLNCFCYLGSERLPALSTMCLLGCQACVWVFVCFALVCLLISLPFIQFFIVCAGDIRLLFKLLLKFRNVLRNIVNNMLTNVEIGWAIDISTGESEILGLTCDADS